MAFIILLCIPLIAAFVSACIQKKRALIEVVALVALLTEAGAFFSLASDVLHNGVVTFSSLLSLNALGTLFCGVVVMVGAVAGCYSIGFMRQEMKNGGIGMHRVRQFYALFHLFLFSMFAAIVLTHPILMWIAVEGTTLSTVFLISFYGKPNTVEAAWKFLIINSVALLLGFLGTLIFIGLPSHFSSVWSFTNAALVNPALLKIAFVLVLVGYGTKTGFVPLHTWLPDAHGMAPVPISSLLSGALLNVSFFALLRFTMLTDSVMGNTFTQQIFLAFGLLSVCVAALLIFTQRNYKRMLAYSSIEHMGVMALGIAAGGFGIFAALLHMIYHAMTKSLLFLSSGNIMLRYGTAKTAGVHGMRKALPLTTALFFAGALSITGVPPFGTFITEFLILSALMSAHIVSALILLAALVLVCIGLLKVFSSMMAGEPPAQNESSSRVEQGWTIAPIAVLLAFLFVLSVMLPHSLNALLTHAASLF